jgi:hypothetical protein
MAAEIKLNGGVRRDVPLREEQRGAEYHYLLVTIGKSEQLREIRLTETQLLALVVTSGKALQRLESQRFAGDKKASS